eukprot:Skav221660  [mRNA]  locus=scaffold1750:188721:189344:+ [translate_table: standard]
MCDFAVPPNRQTEIRSHCEASVRGCVSPSQTMFASPLQLTKCGALRGGGGSLLESLTVLLEKSEPVDHEQALFSELTALVKRKPTNLLQEFKSLVTKFTKMGPSKTPARQVVLKPSVSSPSTEAGWQTVSHKRKTMQSGPKAPHPSWHFRRDGWKAPRGMAIIGFPDHADHLAQSLDDSSGIAWVMSTSQPGEAEEALQLVDSAVRL